MLKFPNNVFMVETVEELPALAGAKAVYLDFETSSGNPKLDSLNPWHNCKVHGFGITVDEIPEAYYIPFSAFNTEQQIIIICWLREILQQCEQWVNQNIKYDAHVAANDLQISVEFMSCWLVCTLTLAKLIDSDRIMRGGYGLDVLSRDWLEEDISEYEAALQPYLGKKNKDYGKVPHDVMAPYAGQDVLTNRRLCKYITEKLPDQCQRVAFNEIELTRNLWKMERNGLGLYMQELKVEEYKVLNRLCKIDDALNAILGRSINPKSTDDVYEVLCVQYGLPIIAFTKNQDTGEFTTNPSFDKHALRAYKARPDAPKDIIELIEEYRELAQHHSLFVAPWQEFAIFDERYEIWFLHSTYNQAVRTGRMSCSEPNAQQLSKRAKKLIRPKPGHAFISIDYSQIEFRFIVHYIQDAKAIEAFHENPDVDFHLLVGSWCEIKRKPAKTVNFGVAFGEGKKKLIKQLANDPDLCEVITKVVKGMIDNGEILPEQEVETFQTLAIKKGEQVYAKYHDTFPTLKTTARMVESSLKQRYGTHGLGYVFNVFGRHRHLPFDKAYRGFNTLNQASAADLIKEQTNKICRMIEGLPIELKAIVHDECLFEAPIEVAYDPRTIRDLVLLMEHPDIEIRVPIRCAVGISQKNWAEAGDADMQAPFEYHNSLLFDRKIEDFNNLNHLREAQVAA